MQHESENLIPNKLYQHLTQRALNAINESLVLSKKQPHSSKAGYATPAHLLCALSESEGSMAKNVLSNHGINSKKLLDQIKKKSTVNPDTQNTAKIKYDLSPEYKKALKRSAGYAMEQGHYFIGTEHLLYGILEKTPKLPALTPQKTKEIKEQLREMMLNYISLETHLGNPKNGVTPLLGTDAEDYEAELQEAFSSSSKMEASAAKANPALESFCDNLSQRAREGSLDPVVGRDKEINRVVRALSRKTKNNPLLIGDAGVGKTAIVHGLANKIREGGVPKNLLNKNIYALNLSSLLAGTMYRGEFEERIQDLVEEAEKGDVILFVDEIHMLPGAGAAQGSLDAANILKPALASGALQCVGATTYEEYKKTLEKDSALDRRFQKIFIKEQSPEEALQTLTTLKPYYELHHGVEVENNILELCVDLSLRYMPNRTLPDKALDVLDEAASYARSSTVASENFKKLHSLKEGLSDTIQKKETALQKEHYKKALTLKNKQESLEKQIAELQEQDVLDTDMEKIDEEAVYAVVSEMTSVPLQQITKKEQKFLDNLENTIQSHIFGQEEAINKITKTIRRNKAGVRRHSRPVGSFLFIGPSGTGKTELAKTLAHVLSGTSPESERTPESLIKLDMSEFSESHSVARLIGAPPGYVGHEESGFLTDRVKRNPHSVILFDEIEKAHSKIFNILLQILEDGTLTDSQGRTADFKNSYVILTSNIGSEHFSKNNQLGFSSATKQGKEDGESALKSLNDFMKPEILNRMDEVVMFKNLNNSSLEKIAKAQIKLLTHRLATGSTSVKINSTVAKWIVRNAKDRQKNARAIRKAVEFQLEEPLAELILQDKTEIKVKVSDGKLEFESK